MNWREHIRTEQGLTGILPKSAATMERAKIDRFIRTMENDTQGNRGVRNLRMKQRSAIYAFCFIEIKRLVGAGHIIAPNTIICAHCITDDYVLFARTFEISFNQGLLFQGFSLPVKPGKTWTAKIYMLEKQHSPFDMGELWIVSKLEKAWNKQCT